MENFITQLASSIRIEEAKLKLRQSQVANPGAYLGQTLQESRTPEFIEEMKRAFRILKCAQSAVTEMDRPNDQHHIDCSICVEEIKSHKHMQLHVVVTSDPYEFFDLWKEPEAQQIEK